MVIEFYKQLYVHKFNELDEIDQFFERLKYLSAIEQM